MISVYRIYLGRSWVAGGEASRLRALFDGLPDFLHVAGTLPDPEPGLEPHDKASCRAAVKVAMTQTHVAVVWGGSDDPAPDWTEHELNVAKDGFRRCIPILAVVPDGREPASAIIRRLADRTVGWCGLDIARAVQELAEAAAAERRSEIERLTVPLGEDPVAGPLPSPARDDGRDTPRRLPTAEIVAAYDRLKAARSGRSSGGSA